MRPSWEQHWLDQIEMAARMSTCLTRHVGAVVVRDRRIIATGFNGNTPGARHCTDGGCPRCAARHKDPELRTLLPAAALDICTCVHAEVNAIAQCARYGTRTAEATIYVTTKPCLECIKLCASAGLAEVVYRDDYPVAYDVPPSLSLRQFGT